MKQKTRWFGTIIFSIILAAGCGGGGGEDSGDGEGGSGGGSYVVLAYSDLGMHCMNEDFSEIMLLPPGNNLLAQVIRRGGEPDIIRSGVTVSYSIPGNTHSADKTNFWDFAPLLLGQNLPDDIGLTGNGLAGVMVPSGRNDWIASGIPLTPLTDNFVVDPYQLATVTVSSNGTTLAETRAVVPVSWEISCNLCHTGGTSTANDILRSHDQLHGTSLESSTPVACGDCHAQAPLGRTGMPGVPSLSSAMHTSHAPRMAGVGLDTPCYACHPGIETRCQRDVHYSEGMNCESCHESMEAVGDSARRPWVDLPRCGDCHSRRGYQFEEAGKLFRESRGHQGVHCAACHGSPHAIAPSVEPNDNVQAIDLQGHAGTINTCTVCHTGRPDDGFNHSLHD